jgi:hypothetical protein
MTSEVPVDTNLKERLIGAVLLALGLLVGFVFVFRPYVAMSTSEPQVDIRLIRTMLGPLLMQVGLLQLALGSKAPALLGRSGPPTWRTLLVAGAMFAVAYLVYLWLKQQAAQYGYQAP